MRLKTTSLLSIAAVAIIVSSGYVHGLWSFRWSAEAELEAAAEKLSRVPMSFGDWTGVENPIEERQLQVGRIAASVARIYTNTKTGQKISFLIVCGRPGPISIHTPDVCYGNSGYVAEGGRSRLSIDSGGPRPAEFVAIRMKKPDPIKPSTLAIDFGWFAGGGWTAPLTDARFRYAGYPVIFKMYVIREQTRPDDRNDFDPNGEFLKAILPELQKILGASDHA